MPRNIQTDGETYTFTPGKGGSLISTTKKRTDELSLVGKSVAKTIKSPTLKSDPEIRKKRYGIVRVLAVRG